MPEKSSLPLSDSTSRFARRRRYRIVLRGQIDQRWVAGFDPVAFASSAEVTTIEVLADQAGLRFILNRLWDLNLAIYSVAEVGEPAVRDGGK